MLVLGRAARVAERDILNSFYSILHVYYPDVRGMAITEIRNQRQTWLSKDFGCIIYAKFFGYFGVLNPECSGFISDGCRIMVPGL